MKAKAKVGDLIRLVYSSDYEHSLPGTVLRVHDILDMSVVRDQLEKEREEMGEEFFNFAYPSGTYSDEVKAFPPWVRMGVNIYEECFGSMHFLENEDYEVLTEEEAAAYIEESKDRLKRIAEGFNSREDGTILLDPHNPKHREWYEDE
ncbi:hypothetical protein 035JT004_259 [Bacillus phage 035JT004]|nr:hypothetical protein 035JT004_259 [Bacillus phage 035JT004]